MGGAKDWAKDRPPIMSDAVKITQQYLDNVWVNFNRWRELNGISQEEAFQTIKNLSNGEVKFSRLRRYDSEHERRVETDTLKSVVFIAKIMRQNPIDLMAGEIDFRKL